MVLRAGDASSLDHDHRTRHHVHFHEHHDHSPARDDNVHVHNVHHLDDRPRNIDDLPGQKHDDDHEPDNPGDPDNSPTIHDDLPAGDK